MKTTVRWSTAIAAVLFLEFAGVPQMLAQAVGAPKLRWDITTTQPGPGGVPPSPTNLAKLVPGGIASAWAYNPAGAPRLKITVTGSGTFSPFDATDVSGGGEFIIQRWNASAGLLEDVSSGTYRVTEMVSFNEVATAPPFVSYINGITNTTSEDLRVGHLVLRIAYSDGSRGLLIVSCSAGGYQFEGIAASKGFVTFANHESPNIRVCLGCNFPLFTILRN